MLHIYGHNLADYTIADLPVLLDKNDVLVVNNTKVLPVQLQGKKGEASISITLLKADIATEQQNHTIWQAFAKPAKKLQVGDVINIADADITVTAKHEDGSISLSFPFSYAACLTWLETHGSMPLPPYITKQRGEGATEADKKDYQTLFAQHQGAVAAPTASLHFTEALLKQLQTRGVEMAEITLHVGAGTFLPVKTEEVHAHVMHSETLEITADTTAQLNAAKAAGKRIVAVGTTVMRALESAANEHGVLQPMQGETDIFITPGYRFRYIDRMLTNFHLPESTLLMLVSAFAGTEAILQAYQHAIEAEYRFYSYGDACLLERAD